MKGIVIVAKTRTGTNWLREILAASSNGQNLGEVLRSDERFEGNFFSWFQDVHGALKPDRSHPWVSQVLTGYLDHIEQHFAVPILDIKYTAFSAFEPSWRSPLAVPVLLQLLMDRGYRVIHQRRASYLATSVSEAVAARTGVYTAYQDHYRPPSLELEVDEVMRMALEYRNEFKFVSDLLSQDDTVVELTYETLVTCGQDGTLDVVVRKMMEDTDLEYRGMGVVALKRLLPNWRESVLNWQEIGEAAKNEGLS